MLETLYGPLVAVNVLFLALLSVTVAVKNPRSIFNRVFSLTILCAALWVSTFFVRHTTVPFPLLHTKAEYLFWARISHYASATVVMLCGYFMMIFPDRAKRPYPLWFTVPYVLALPVGMTVLIYRDLIIDDMRPLGEQYYIIPGRLFSLFLYYFLFYLFSGLLVALQKYRRLEGLQKAQLKFLLFAIISSVLPGIVTNILLPELSKFFPGLIPLAFLFRIAPLFALFFIYFVAYTIIRHRTLEIEALISRSAGYLLATTVVVAVYLGLVALGQNLFRQLASAHSPLFTALGVVMMAIIFHPVRLKIQDGVYRKFFAQKFEYQKVLLDSSRRLVTMLNRDELLDFFVELVHKQIGTDRVAFFLPRSGVETPRLSRGYAVAFHKGLPAHLAETAEPSKDLVKLLYREKNALIKEDLQDRYTAGEFADLYRGLEPAGAEVLIPVFVHDRLEGILAIDRKISGRLYTQSDINILTILAAEVGIAVENARLYGEAISDELTGLFNFRYFQHRLREEISLCLEFLRPLSLMMVDIDEFKLVNDTHGHTAGDHILREMGKILRTSVRHADIPCRYGGDEFMVILPEEDNELINPSAGFDAEPAQRNRNLGLRVKNNVERHGFKFMEKTIRITVSVGVIHIPSYQEGQLSPEKLVELVDAALYKAKNAGRNRVESVVVD